MVIKKVGRDVLAAGGVSSVLNCGINPCRRSEEEEVVVVGHNSRLKSKLKHVVNTVETHVAMTQNCTNGLARHHVLAILGMLGLALGGLVQQSTTVSILALTDPMSSEEFAAYVANTSYVKMYCKDPHKHASNSTDDDSSSENDSYAEHDNFTSLSNTTYDYEEDDRDEALLKVPMLEEDREDSMLREAFLWGAMISPLPGFWVSQKFGAKRLFGAGVLAAGALSLLVPAAWGTWAHVVLRAAQGAATGVMWPALHVLAATWCPKPQRSLFVSSYAAWSVGCAVAGLLGPTLVRHIGRDSIFYLEGALALAWFTAWSMLVANTPTSAAKDTWYLAFQPHSSGRRTTRPPSAEPARPLPVPWRQLITSCPMWSCTIAVLGGQWGQATLHIAGTKYLEFVYGFALTNNRVLFSLPHVGYFLCAVTFGLLADHVIGREIVSITTTRKMLVYIAHFWPAAILFVIGYTGCDPSAPAALFVAAAIVSSALEAGAYASALEIAPNYAGAVFAICHTAGAAGGLIANYVITEGLHGSLPGSWRVVFGVASLVLILTASFFLAVGSGAEQSWNKLNTEDEGVELPTVEPSPAPEEQEPSEQNLLSEQPT